MQFIINESVRLTLTQLEQKQWSFKLLKPTDLNAIHNKLVGLTNAYSVGTKTTVI
jgi:hypothetical protein